MDIEGLSFQDEELEYFDSGRLQEGTLAKDAIIEGLPCVGGSDVVFYSSGRPKLVSLSESTNVDGVYV